MASPKEYSNFSSDMRSNSMAYLAFLSLMMVLTMITIYNGGPIRNTSSVLQCSSILDQLEEKMSRAFREEMARKTPNPDLPVIYVITPTYRRQEQIPEMTRFAQTLLNVPSIHWIIADDSNTTNHQLIALIEHMQIPYTYLLTPMPSKYKDNPKIKAKPKGVANRNGAMEWIRNHATSGVFFFADDDNSYDLRVFQEMRYTKKVSMWPVGLVTHAGLSSPVVSQDGKFVGWYDGWIGGRKFPVDMACFAVNVQYFKTTKALMPYKAGYEEDGFLRSLNIKPEEIEFKADGCTKIYVWHTQTKKNYASDRKILLSQYDQTNLRILQQSMIIKPEAKQTLKPAKKTDDDNNNIKKEDTKILTKR